MVTIIEKVATVILLILTAHALWIHTNGGELDPWEVVALEVVWIPILAKCNGKCRRPLIVTFAAFSGYFLPRLFELLPVNTFIAIMMPDVISVNWFLKMMGTNWYLLPVKDYGIVVMAGKPVAKYSVGCSSLRAAPLLALTALAAPGPWRRRLLAALIGIILSYPANAIRVWGIIVVAKIFHLSFHLAHVIISPLFSIIFVGLVMVIQDLVLPGYLDVIADGLDCLFSCIPKPWSSNKST